MNFNFAGDEHFVGLGRVLRRPGKNGADEDGLVLFGEPVGGSSGGKQELHFKVNAKKIRKGYSKPSLNIGSLDRQLFCGYCSFLLLWVLFYNLNIVLQCVWIKTGKAEYLQQSHVEKYATGMFMKIPLRYYHTVRPLAFAAFEGA